MSLLPTASWTTPETAYFATASGGGGGSNNFTTLNINEGGSLNIGSSVNQGTTFNFYKDVAGASTTSLSMIYSPSGGVPGNLRLTITDQTFVAADMLQAGDLRAYGMGTNVQIGDCAVLGTQGTGQLGLYRTNGDTGTTNLTYAILGSNFQALSNLSSVNSGTGAINMTQFASTVIGYGWADVS